MAKQDMKAYQEAVKVGFYGGECREGAGACNYMIAQVLVEDGHVSFEEESK